MRRMKSVQMGDMAVMRIIFLILLFPLQQLSLGANPFTL